MLRKLTEIANKLDSLKLYKEADKVDNVIKKIAQMNDEFDFPMLNMDNNLPSNLDMSSDYYGILKGDAEQYLYSSESPEIEESRLKEAIASYINRKWHSEYIGGGPFEESSFKVGNVIKPEDLKIEWTNDLGDSTGPGQEYGWLVTFDDYGSNGIVYRDAQMPIWIVNEYDYPPSAVQTVEGTGHDGNPKVFFLYGER